MVSYSMYVYVYYRSTKKYFHSLIFKLDEETFQSLDHELSAYASPPNKEIPPDETTGNVPDSAAPCESAARGMSTSSPLPSHAPAATYTRTLVKETDGLLLLIRELRYARRRYRTGPYFWGRSHTRGLLEQH